jgi:hypothetical protein
MYKGLEDTEVYDILMRFLMSLSLRRKVKANKGQVMADD